MRPQTQLQALWQIQRSMPEFPQAHLLSRAHLLQRRPLLLHIPLLLKATLHQSLQIRLRFKPQHLQSMRQHLSPLLQALPL